MAASKQKSRTFRRIRKTTPGGRRVTHYVKPRHARPLCSACGTVLSGVSRGGEHVPKSARRPERPYGGVFCSACSRRRIITQVRMVKA